MIFVPYLDLKFLVMMKEKSIHLVVRCLFYVACLFSCPYLQLHPAEQGSVRSVGICIEQLTAVSVFV